MIFKPWTLPYTFPSFVCPAHPKTDALYRLWPVKYFQMLWYPAVFNSCSLKAGLIQILKSTGKCISSNFFSTLCDTVSKGCISSFAIIHIWTMKAMKQATWTKHQGFLFKKQIILWRTHSFFKVSTHWSIAWSVCVGRWFRIRAFIYTDTDNILKKKRILWNEYVAIKYK